MIRIKDYIFSESEVLQITKGMQKTLFLTLKYSDRLQQIDNVTFEDIEWNYGTPQETQRQMQKELCKSCYYRDTISNELKELEEKNKTFEDYNKDLNRQLDKLEERINKAIEFIKDDEFYCKNQDEQKEFNYTLLDILKRR